jgi:hypothetical protein
MSSRSTRCLRQSAARGSVTVRLAPVVSYQAPASLSAWAEDRAAELLPDTSRDRRAHVNEAIALAREISPMFESHEAELLVAAAAVHDLGHSPRLRDTGFEPLDAARYVDSCGAPAALARLAANYFGVQAEASLRGLSDLYEPYPDEMSEVRDAFWYCDLRAGAAGQRVTVARRCDEVRERYGWNPIVQQFMDQIEPELHAAAERTEARLRQARIEVG